MVMPASNLTLAQGLLTDRYLSGIPADARASKPHGFLKKRDIAEDMLARVRALNNLAQEREQSLARMALAWVLRDERMTSALIGASRVEQIEQNVATLSNLTFTSKDLSRIEGILENA
jgi:L-glyceraldehyde 3-phosphate reductase